MAAQLYSIWKRKVAIKYCPYMKHNMIMNETGCTLLGCSRNRDCQTIGMLDAEPYLLSLYRRPFCIELYSSIHPYFTPIKQWGQGRDTTFSLGLIPLPVCLSCKTLTFATHCPLLLLNIFTPCWDRLIICTLTDTSKSLPTILCFISKQFYLHIK
jgi:hypothetical protein